MVILVIYSDKLNNRVRSCQPPFSFWPQDIAASATLEQKAPAEQAYHGRKIGRRLVTHSLLCCQYVLSLRDRPQKPARGIFMGINCDSFSDRKISEIFSTVIKLWGNMGSESQPSQIYKGKRRKWKILPSKKPDWAWQPRSKWQRLWKLATTVR